MCFPGPREIDTEIRERLAQHLLVPLHARCVAKGYRPSVHRLKKAMEKVIDAYVDEWALASEDDWSDWVQSNYPAFDLAKGGEQDDGSEEEIRAEYVEHKELSLLGWYYEDNGNGEIEDETVKAVVRAMKKEKIKKDPRSSSNDAVLKAAADEWWDEYPDEAE